LLPSRGRQFGSDKATEGVAGELDTIQARRVEPAGQPFAQKRGPHRMAEAWKIHYVHAPSRGQRLEHRGPPPPGSREPVDEHKGLAAAGYPVRDGVTIHLDLVDLHRHLIQSGRCGCG
jgi:hypothetical protein